MPDETGPGTGHFRGEGGMVWEMDLPLPETQAEKVAKGYLTRVNADGSPYVEPAVEGDSELAGPPSADKPAPPAPTAPKREWVGYAVRVGGMSPDDAEAMTKSDLVEKFGK